MITLFEDYNQMSEYVTAVIGDMIVENPKLNIGLPTGETPIGFYRNIIQTELDWGSVKTFNTDEYVGLSENHPESSYMYMKRKLFLHTNINEKNIHFPDGNMDNIIQKFNGLDVTLLGVGTNGHVGYNEPGSSHTSPTRRVKLSPSTIEKKSKLFNEGDLPKWVFTMGMKTIRQSKKIIVIANGSEKWDIIDKCFNGPISKDLPASILQLHPNVEVLYCQ